MYCPGDKVVVYTPNGLKTNINTRVMEIRGMYIAFPVAYGDKRGLPIISNVECEWDRVILGIHLPFYDEIKEEIK